MRIAAAVAALPILLACGGAAAAEPLVWRSEWRRFQTWEWIATGTATVALVTSYLVAPTKPRTHGPIWFDDPVRDALRPETEAGRSRASTISDISYWSLAAFPFIGDATVTAAFARKSGDVAQQMVLMDAEAIAINGLLFKIIELSVRRARPFVGDCLDTGKTVDECNAEGGATTSMPAGHVSTAVTGASLICTHHLRLGLYGSTFADGAACAVGIAVAITATVSRVASDNHYATDAAVGALIGVFSGFVVPTTLHYGWTSSQPKVARALPVVPLITPTTLGAAYITTL